MKQPLKMQQRTRAAVHLSGAYDVGKKKWPRRRVRSVGVVREQWAAGFWRVRLPVGPTSGAPSVA
jgi:hypothetical protein